MDQLPEQILIGLVRNGQWKIDEQGRIWRTFIRKGLKAGGSHLVPCAPRRVEKRTPQGYLMVRAMIDGERIHAMAHRLVWQHINGDIIPGHEINHDNGLKDDNRPANLLCGTGGDNAKHAHAFGLCDQFGQKNPSVKLTDNQVAQIRLAYERGGYTQAQLAKRFNVSHQAVSKIVKGQRRPKQGGPTTNEDHRHCVADRDVETGKFIGKKLAGRLLDGIEHNGYPEVRS